MVRKKGGECPREERKAAKGQNWFEEDAHVVEKEEEFTVQSSE